MKKIILFLLSSILLAGCSTPSSFFKIDKDPDRGSTLTYSPDLRSLHILEKNGNRWIILEPNPDVAFDVADSADVDISFVSFGGGDESADGSGQSDSVSTALPGRSTTLLLAREFNYRLAEMAFNTNMTSEEYQKAFGSILSTIQAVAEAEIEKSDFKHSFTLGETIGLSSSFSETDDEAGSVKSETDDEAGSVKSETDDEKTTLETP